MSRVLGMSTIPIRLPYSVFDMVAWLLAHATPRHLPKRLQAPVVPEPALPRHRTIAAALLALAPLACTGQARARRPTVIVLGFDGMDYELTKQMMAEGRLPNLSKLAALGAFQPLGTAMPPQSPVAWSNFITGLDAGGHGIFDFVHRDPKTMIPYLSTSRAEASERKLKLGKYQIPLGADKVELLRRVDDAARSAGASIVQVSAGYGDSRKGVLIANSDGLLTDDEVVRCLLRVSAVADGDTGMQTGYQSMGHTIGFEVFDDVDVEDLARDAARGDEVHGGAEDLGHAGLVLVGRVALAEGQEDLVPGVDGGLAAAGELEPVVVPDRVDPRGQDVAGSGGASVDQRQPG
jgi:hypothetical protein